MFKKILSLVQSTAILASVFLFGFSDQVQAQNITVRELLDKMYVGISNAKTYAFEMYSKERFGSKYIETEMIFRINETPKKVYAKDKKNGIEILYASGWNNGKLLINPNGAPWFNVSFAPTSDRVRKDNHHMVTNAGFAFTKNMLVKTEKMIKEKNWNIADFFFVQGETIFDGRICYKLNMEYKDFAIVDYTVTKTMDLQQLCAELSVPEYWVKERNNIDFGTVKAGKVLKIPSSYAKKVIFYIDKQTFLPLVQLLYDDKDLYEKYEYRSLKLNYTPALNEWTEDCKDYGF